MESVFRARQISEHVYWVGAIDWELRDFHGYATPRGSTYNAYLILADKVTLIDTVKSHFKDELLGRIASIIDPEKIDYIISNHSEMDHSGCLAEVMDIVQPERVFASAKGVMALNAHFGLGDKVEKINKKEPLDLGNMSLTFIETPMVHWPDSMFTYLDKDKVLFSNDAFGMHLASSERFDDELNFGILEEETAKYYANILLPTSKLVNKLPKSLDKLGELELIAPDHGPIWRSHKKDVLDWYGKWSSRELKEKAVILYDTMWGSTAKIARAIAEGLMSEGIQYKLMPLQQNDRSEVALEVLDASALIVGSPTLNANLFPTVADALAYLEGLNPGTPNGAVFGSYGWSDKSTGKLEEWLTRMKIELVETKLTSNYVPGADALLAGFELGVEVAQQIKKVSE